MPPAAPRLVPARRGFSLQYRDTLLLSSIDPLSQSERIVETVDLRPQTIYLCLSPLLGYGLALLMARKEPSSAILCVEIDPQLHKLSQEALSPLIEAHPRDIALAPEGTRDTAALIQFFESQWPPRSFRRLVCLKTNRGWTLDALAYTALEQGLRDNIHREWQNAITLIRLGQRYTGNLIRNLPLLAKSPDLSCYHQDSVPILALGAGPSLDPLMDQLVRAHPGIRRRNTRPFSIICVDTALRPLLERGIEVDAVLALEAQYWNLLDFIGTGTVPLILDLASHYATWRAVASAPSTITPPEYLIATRWASLKLFDRLENAKLLPEGIPPLGSVGLSLIYLALQLTHSRIVIAGLDFAFTRDLFHAKGTSHSIMYESSCCRLKGLFNAERAFRPGLRCLRDKTGREVISDPALEGYRNLFNEQFSHETRVLDAGETGLDLGIRRISSQEANEILFEEATATSDSPLRFRDSVKKKRPRVDVAKIGIFIQEERERLIELRERLCGMRAAETERIATLLEELDYLWAHFAEYRGTRSIAQLATDPGFLKRVRAGIDRSLKDWLIASRELE